jgi:hypothetical protein
MASFDRFDSIKNIALKSDFNNLKIIDSISISIENLIMITTEQRALNISQSTANYGSRLCHKNPII